MPLLLPGGQTFDQKTVTVAKDDATVNASIQAEQLNEWIVQDMIIDGGNVIILYSKTSITGMA